MKEIITIAQNAYAVPIQKETVWKKPPLSKSSLFRLPWEVYPFGDMTVVRQQMNLIGTHLQIIEAKNDYEAVLPLTASDKMCTLFFVLQGGVKHLGTAPEKGKQLLSPSFTMVYFPPGRTDLALPAGRHNFLIISLEFDWPLSFPHIIDTFQPLMDCWDRDYPSAYMLPACEIPFKLKRILVKMRRIAILDFKESLDMLIYVSQCIKLYHEQNSSKSLVAERGLLKCAKRLLSYIEENYMLDGRCKLEVVAEQFGTTNFVLQRTCNVIYGKTFFQLLTDIRIEQSCKLLKETKMDINQIAVEVGYASLNSYGKTFKRIKGLAPKQYRNHTG